MRFGLLTKPTQFVRGKTQETLCEVMKRWEKYNLAEGDDITRSESDYHLIDIIITNNSLLETDQWKYRTTGVFNEVDHDINIGILSSKSKDFKSINDYIAVILEKTQRQDLPNVLINCAHNKRIDDIIQLFRTFGGTHPLILPNIPNKTMIKFHISFDEPDANIGTTHAFLRQIQPFIPSGHIEGVLFITATPMEKFWKTLHKNGITSLLNISKDSLRDYDQDLSLYQDFQNHNIHIHNNDTNNPLIYIMDLIYNNKISTEGRRIIFAPGHTFTNKEAVGSHEEIASFFLNKGYTVLIMNGTFKEFRYSDTSITTLEDYRLQNNITGELRDVLRHWAQAHPTENLAITGYMVIERGVTFNTDGFNFTDMIFSKYHLSEFNRLIQLVGRGCGGKKYVNKMNVYVTDKIYDLVLKYTNKLNEILKMGPETFNITDFSSSERTIPVKLVINDLEVLSRIIMLRSESKRGYKHDLHRCLQESLLSGAATIYDRNNINKFDINSRTLNNVRMYKEGDKVDVRRFKQFNDAFERHCTTSQTCSETEYNLDLAKDTYRIPNSNFVNETNVMWITFRV